MILHPSLEQSSSSVVDLPLCQVRLSHNASWPWLLLIPRLENIVELIDLNEAQQQQLMREIDQTSRVMRDLFKPDKLNVATLGNVVPQLHVHVIGRYKTDAAWPNPVWNSGVSTDYPQEQLENLLTVLLSAFLSPVA